MKTGLSIKARTTGKPKLISTIEDIAKISLPQTPELLADLKGRVAAHLEQGLAGTANFVVGLHWSGDSRRLSVRIDGDKGVNIDVCSQLNRSLGKLIDEHGWQGAVVLEVGSPGAETPLVLLRQYPQHIGRRMRIVQRDGAVLLGTLSQVEGSGLSLQGEDERELKLSFEEIKEAKVVIS